MGIKINQYPLERTVFGDDDYYDIDYWNGATFESAKIKGSVIKSAIQSGVVSLYTNNGTLATNREVNGNQKSLDFGLNVVSNNLTHYRIHSVEASEKYSGSFPFNVAGLEITKNPSTNKSLLLLNATNGSQYIQELDNHYFNAQVGNKVTTLRIDENQVLTGVTDGTNPLSHKITQDWVEIVQNTAQPVLKLEHNGGLLEFGGLNGLGNAGSNLVMKIKFNQTSSTTFDMLDFAGNVGLRIANYTTTGGINQYSSIVSLEDLYVASGTGKRLHLTSGDDEISFARKSTGTAFALGTWNQTRLKVEGNIELNSLATVDGRDVSEMGIKLDTIETGAQVNDIVSKTITVQEPEVGDNITIFKTGADITVQEVVAVSTGTGTINTSYQISFGANRSATGSNLVGNQSTTSTTSGDVATLGTTQIPADNWVFIKINSISGTDVYLTADIRYTED